jgi:hypothetical protein
MFSLTHLIVYAAIAVLFYLLGVLGGRRSAKANAYADQLYAYGKRLEAEVAELRARQREGSAE